MQAAGRAALALRRVVIDRYVDLITSFAAELAADHPDEVRPLARELVVAAVGGINELILARVEKGEAGRLDEDADVAAAGRDRPAGTALTPLTPQRPASTRRRAAVVSRGQPAASMVEATSCRRGLSVHGVTGLGGPAYPHGRHHQGDDDERDTHGQRETLRREGADAVVELRGTVGQLLLTGSELQHAVVQLTGAVGELAGAPGQLVDACGELGSACDERRAALGEPRAVGGELPDTVVELLVAGRQLADAVSELAGAGPAGCPTPRPRFPARPAETWPAPAARVLAPVAA